MQSTDLRGFEEWMKVILDNYHGLLEKLPKKPGVYAFRYEEPFGRFIGSSDILYVGKTENRKGIRERVRQHFDPGPTQWTCQRVNAFLKKFGLEGEVELSYVEVNNPRASESFILDMYEDDHGELPPLNRSN